MYIPVWKRLETPNMVNKSPNVKFFESHQGVKVIVCYVAAVLSTGGCGEGVANLHRSAACGFQATLHAISAWVILHSELHGECAVVWHDVKVPAPT